MPSTYYPMDQLPLSHEELRSLFIEALAVLEGPSEIVEFRHLLGKVACRKGIVPDPNGPSPNHDARYILNRNDVARIQDVLWDLIIEGVVRPGLGDSNGNSDLPFFHVTEYGAVHIKNGTGSPHDPDGYFRRLKSDIQSIDPVITTYLNECLHSFRIGCLLSSAVMLGCASEKAFLLLVDNYLKALPTAKSDAFRAKIEGKFIKKQFDEFNKMLEGNLRGQLPAELCDSLNNILTGIFEMIRSERNDSGHPTGKTPSREVAFANISVFPGYLKRIYELITWLQSKSPCGLT